MILVTGGTGTLGRRLVERLASSNAGPIVVLTRSPNHAARMLPTGVAVIHGDVRLGPGLGVAPAERSALRDVITGIIHCAADTTFNHPLDDARASNVEGTRSILDFARECAKLQRVMCFSTVYVAGRATGCFAEDDAGGAYGFVNTYEQSKAEMEALVGQRMAELPIALVRLSTIIGDSRNGEVTGFNAVHHALRLLYQGLAPMVPGQESSLVDLIPVDYATDASHHLFADAFEPGATYHVCAGARASATLGSLLDATMAAFERHRPAWRKRSIVRPALVDLGTYELFVRSVEEAGNTVLLQATRAVQAFAYQLAYPKVFDARRAERALRPNDIEVPPVLSYYEYVVRWCIETGWGAPP
jgi:nucleoside-diphosphate-sugar epimerase